MQVDLYPVFLRPALWLGLSIVAAFCLTLAATPKPVQAADGNCPPFFCLSGGCLSGNSDQEKGDCKTGDDKEEEPKCSYGPSDCEPRKTLMQWSYGTTFSGGPPSMDEPLESDRPGFTVSTVTVGRGVVQLETGYTYTLDNAGGVHQVEHDFPDTLWRIGMFAEWFEWRIEYNYSIIDTTIDRAPLPPLRQHLSGSDDLLLGCKIALTPQEGILPQMCLLPQMSVPSGSPGLTAGLVMPGVLWGYEWKLNEKFTLTGLTAVMRSADDNSAVFTEFDQALSLQCDITKKLQVYDEWYVISPSGQTIERTQHYMDGGFAYHVTNNIQLDIEAGVGLNAAANNFFVGTGAALRF
jgi:hypothetical protein